MQKKFKKKKAPVKKTSVKKALAKKMPVKKISVKTAPVKIVPVKTEAILYFHKIHKFKELIGWGLVVVMVFVLIALISAYSNSQGKNPLADNKLPQASMLSPAVENDEDAVSIIAVGDVLLARYIELSMRQFSDYNYPFRLTAEFLRSADITVGSLNNTLISGKNNPMNSVQFRSDPQAASGLSFAGFDVMAVANKQMMNYKAAGLTQTLNELKNAGVSYAGAGQNINEAHTPAIVEAKGKKIAIYAYVDANLAPNREDGASINTPGLAEMDIEAVKNDVKNALKQADYVVVSMHAGSEYKKEPTKFQKDFAHAAIDAGASVVIGHHSHVVQPVEYYKDGVIFYSLGNFVFDQFFSDDVRNGLAAKIYFTDSKKPVVELFPVRIDSAQPKILEGQEREDMLKKMGL